MRERKSNKNILNIITFINRKYGFKENTGKFYSVCSPQNHIVCPDLCLWATATGKQKLISQIKTDLLGFALHLWEGFVWVWVFSFGWGLVFLIKQWNIYDLGYLLKEIIKMQKRKLFVQDLLP